MDRLTFFKNTIIGSSALLFSPLAEKIKSANLQQDQNQITSGIKITDVKGFLLKKAHFVNIKTNAGISGWGESDGANKKFADLYIESNLKKYLIGKDPFDSEGIWHECYLKGIEAGIAGIHPGSLSGIDNALWDLKGKILNMPAYKILGGNGMEKIAVYGSFGREQNDRFETPLEMARRAETFVKQGYKAVKVRMQIRQENVNPYPDDTYECIQEVRNAIGYDTILYVDFNNGYTPAKAIMMGKRLYENFNIEALEEPVFQQDYQGLKQVVEALDIPVMAGEHEYNKWMMKDLITISDVDIINADVILCGGITECRKTASMAHAFGKQIMVHNAKPTLATAASLQLLASIPNATRFQEYAGKREDQGYGSLFNLFENYFEFSDGYLYIPKEPGLGLIVNEKEMEKQKIK
ncbi:MAG: mandelate racemase/muconate lactonizing enzyme family protein [Bacteroidales bacterium]|nr:mandelate racemase/muconate lactonizing enzyme family protein [Bacteroidales bacterium]